MDRCGVFIDAGFLLVAGNYICCESKSRASATCSYEPLIQALATHASRDCGLPVLRTYWYDGAPDAGPRPDRLTIARLREVKLRLGRLVGKRQKGVDALIYRDLMTLARERAVATAYLVAGDDDIREGVVAAQDMGVQVYLLAFETGNPTVGAVAAPLMYEADGYQILEPSFLSPFFSAAHAQPMPETGGAESTRGSAREFGRAFALRWGEGVAAQDIQRLLADAPRIPVEIDARLLWSAEESLGCLRERQPLRRALRAGFWEGIREVRHLESSADS